MIVGVALAAAAVAAASAVAAPDGDARSVTGLWRTPADGGSLVRLSPCEDGLCGRIVTSPHIQADPDHKDVRNRDVSQRGRPLRNLVFLKVKPTGPGSWGDGWVYNPEDGATYTGLIKLQPDGALRLTGCVVAPFCKTQTWRRAD